jgi:hypothetical protein
LQTALSADASAAAAAVPDTAAILTEGSCNAVLRCAAGRMPCSGQRLLWHGQPVGCKALLAFAAGAVCLQKHHRTQEGIGCSPCSRSNTILHTSRLSGLYVESISQVVQQKTGKYTCLEP